MVLGRKIKLAEVSVRPSFELNFANFFEKYSKSFLSVEKFRLLQHVTIQFVFNPFFFHQLPE